MSVNYSPGVGMFEYRNLDYDTSVVVDPIVQNTWYVALVPTSNVKAYYLIIEQTNDGAAAEDIEVELTIDNVAQVGSTNMASGTVHYVFLGINGTSGAVATSPRQLLSLDLDQSAPLETRSLGIRVRQTSAVDVTSAQIEVNMVYEVLR